jgi:hypothetical protein
VPAHFDDSVRSPLPLSDISHMPMPVTLKSTVRSIYIDGHDRPVTSGSFEIEELKGHCRVIKAN